MIEVADHADPLRVRGPDREMNAAEPAMHLDVGTEPLVVAIMRSLRQEVQVEVGEERAEAIGIDKIPRMPLVVLDLDPVRECLAPVRQRPR